MEKSFQLHLDIIQSALKEADPNRLILKRIQRQSNLLILGQEKFSLEGPGQVVAIGKAAGPMLEGIRDLLPDVSFDSLCVTKDGHPTSGETFFASHPVPDSRSIDAAQEILSRAKKLSETPHAWFLLLLSGGASALACAPVAGVSLQEKQSLFQLLLSSGLEISQCNVVRSALSRFKGGGLLRALNQTRSACLVLSDVSDEALPWVGSGPLLEHQPKKNAKTILVENSLWEKTTPTIRQVLTAQDETSRPNVWVQDSSKKIPHTVIGDRRDLLQGALQSLAANGLEVVYQEDSFAGEVSQLVTRLLSIDVKPRQAVIVVGEPTLRVLGSGKGGRAQHAALCVAEKIAGHPGIFFVALASDGTDGPTDAAGAFVDGDTWGRCVSAGVNPREALLNFDSYNALRAANSLLIPGPTGTNVNDLYVLWRT